MIITPCFILGMVPSWDGFPSWLGDRVYYLPHVFLCISALAILGLLATKMRDLPANWRARYKSTLDPEQLEELMFGNPPQIIDLRPREEYRGKRGHIRGAINIPFDEFPKRIEEMDTHHQGPVVLVDENDVLSHQMMPLLEGHGFRWVYVLKGGFSAWRRAKNPVYYVKETK